MGKGLRSTGVAVGALGLLLGTTAGNPAVANPDYETIWEEGTVTSISDGDTLVANLDAGSGARGSNRIRTIGVQAPEVAHNGTLAECGSAQATDRLRAQLPTGARVQTRSVDVASSDAYSSGRIVRSLYAQDEEGNWYDTSRGTVSDGWMMWFPLAADSSNKPEWAHNLEYRVLAEDAASQGRGLWSRDLCGPWSQPDANLRVWASYTQNSDANGDGVADWLQPERVFIENRGGGRIDLSRWTVRDSALNYFRIPDGAGVDPGTVLEVQFNQAGYPQPAREGSSSVVYANTWGIGLNNLPSDNRAFEGDAVYLMDSSGPFGTGNLRSWFPYPCNPDNCGDALQGKVAISRIQDTTPAVRAPSAPGSVAATATTNGSGDVTVTWDPPKDLGGPGVTYTVTPASANDGGPLAPSPSISELEHTFRNLALGRAYTFTVTASSVEDPTRVSPSSDASGPVTPTGLPRDPVTQQALQPSDVVVEGRDTSAIVSWTAPAGAAGEPPLKYTVNAAASPAGPALTPCTTTDGATSCVVTGLDAATLYAFTVEASDTDTTALTTTAALPVAYVKGTGSLTAPQNVAALPGDSRAVVSWDQPASDGGHPISAYHVKAYQGSTEAGTCAATSAQTSCVVTGLTNGTSYTFLAMAENSDPTVAKRLSPWSDPSAATPFQYVNDQGPDAGSPPPDGTHPDGPWVAGEFVELVNNSGEVAHLGGYAFWDLESAGGSTDNDAYQFLPNETLDPGKKLRVHFGAPPSPEPPAPQDTTYRWTGAGEFIGSTGDYIELANLNRAQVSCVPTMGGTCRGTQAASISSPPLGVTARSTSSTVSVSWGAPISRGGTDITQYTATAFDTPVGGNPIGSCTAGGGERACSFPAGVGAKYYVELVAHNAQGISGPSWRVLAAPRTVPSAPGSVAVSGTPGGVNVSWTPAAENGAAITRYTASAYTAGTGGNPVGSCSTSNGSLTSCTIMKLQGGTQYHIDVVATNRAGDGAASSPRTPGTPGPGGAVSTYSKGKVTVRWDPPAPGSNTITGYTATLYTKSSKGTKVGACSAPAGATSCTTKKMKKRSKYYIDLTMQSAAGTFTVKPRIVTGPPKKPSAPKVTSATPAGRQVTVAWAAPSFNGYSYLKGYGARLYSKKKGGSVKASCSAGPSTTTCTTKALKKKGTYYSAVRVKNSKGWSSWSKRVKVVVR